MSETSESMTRSLAAMIIAIDERDAGKMLLPVAVMDMTSNEYLMFDLTTRFAGRWAFVVAAARKILNDGE